MYCEKIRYRDYRNIPEAEIALCDGVNVFVGDNAQGKTNALEGIYYFARGKSFRGARDRELIRLGSDSAALELEFSDAHRRRHHEILLEVGHPRICKKEGIAVRRMSEFIGAFRAVLFSPEHLSIVKDGPSERRNFADIAISQLSPSYVSALSRYQKLLISRNSLLKEPQAIDFDGTLEVLTLQLAREAAVISEHREKYFSRLSVEVDALLSDMTGGRERVSVSYNDARSEQEYIDIFKKGREKEIRAGVTLYGAHKDDILIALNGKDARVYASQGQQRSIALAMKLAEGEISRAESGEYPVFLLDDILSELDEKRKRYVLEGLDGRQVVITACEDIPECARIFKVRDGRYCTE